MSMTQTQRAGVAAIVVTNGSGELDATLTAISQQVYALAVTVVVGMDVERTEPDANADIGRFAALADAVDTLGSDVEFLWVIAEGAVPLPDALKAALADSARTDAGIVGSKIIREDEALISVGLVTDAFGVPYSGLDRSEVDQGQYDVVRDVAAVSGTALLIRRDLLAGLGGVDPTMAPQAAAIDIAQRARIKGARVVVSPASEVRYELEPPQDIRWREEAGRIRSMLKVYSPLTLLWAIPLDLFLGFIEVVVSIFLGKWYGFDYIKAWGWNVVHLPSTIRSRHQARSGRVAGDEELFRYQRKGSVKMVRLSTASSRALRSRLPGDDRFNVEVIGEEIRQPAFVIGVLAVLFVLIASRNLWSDGFPAVGYTLGFPLDGRDALTAYAGGWNPAGLGSADTLRPFIAIAGFAKMITLNAASFPEYALGAGAFLAGIWGTVRLLRTWSISAAPGLIAGVVFMAGPAAQGIAGNTDLGTLLGLGVLPWALRLVLKPMPEGSAELFTRIAAVILTFGLLGAFAPLLLLVPLPVVAIYALMRFTVADAWRAFILALVGTAGGAMLLSPWIWSVSFERIAKAGYAYWNLAPLVGVAGAVVFVAGVIAARRTLGLIAAWGTLVAAIGFLLARSGETGFGREAESAGLAAVGIGTALAIGVVTESVMSHESGGWRRFVLGVGSVGVLVLVVASLTILLGGRIGLPGDRFNSAFEFTLATEGYAETSRILVVGPPDLLPGDSRMIEGGSYRVASAPVPDIGEAWLAHPLEFDESLDETLAMLISGDTKRVGGELALFGIRWIVVMGDTRGSVATNESVAWRDVLAGQLDLLPLTAAVDNTVFITDIHPVSRALTTSGNSWPRTGWTYEGRPERDRRVFVAENPDDGWGPAPRVTTESMNEVSGETGVVTYAANAGLRNQAYGAVIAVVILVIITTWGRRRR